MHDGSKSVNDNEHSRTGETFSDGSSDLGIHPTRSYVSFTRMAAELETHSKSTEEVAERISIGVLIRKDTSPSSITRIFDCLSSALAKQRSCLCP